MIRAAIAGLGQWGRSFVESVRGSEPFPITHAQMLDTTAAFEATLRALETGQPVEVNAR